MGEVPNRQAKPFGMIYRHTLELRFNESMEAEARNEIVEVTEIEKVGAKYKASRNQIRRLKLEPVKKWSP